MVSPPLLVDKIFVGKKWINKKSIETMNKKRRKILMRCKEKMSMLDDTNEQFHQGVLNELDSNSEVPSETRILLLIKLPSSLSQRSSKTAKKKNKNKNITKQI